MVQKTLILLNLFYKTQIQNWDKLRVRPVVGALGEVVEV